MVMRRGRRRPSALAQPRMATATLEAPTAPTAGRAAPHRPPRSRKKPVSKPGTGKPSRKPGTRELASLVYGMRSEDLLEHADEIRLCRSLQRLMELEEIRDEANVIAKQRAPDAELVGPRGASARALPLADVDFASQSAWAAAANLSVAELSVAVREGREAKDRIVASNLKLVGKLVRTVKGKTAQNRLLGTTEHDLMQEGCVALVQAAQKFDVSLGLRFSTYATFWVRAALWKTLRDQGRVIRLPGRIHETYRKIQRAQDEILVQTSQMPTDEQVAARIDGGIPVAKVRETLTHIAGAPRSLEQTVAPSGGDSGDDRTLADSVRDERSDTGSLVVEKLLRDDVQAMLDQHLTPAEVEVVRLRFGLGDGRARTIRVTSEELGHKYRHTQNLLMRALTKLRQPHVSAPLREYNDEMDTV